jgi:hypothetical protein
MLSKKGLVKDQFLASKMNPQMCAVFKKYVCSCIDSYFLSVKNGFASRLAKVHPHLGFAFARPIANLGGNERTGVNFERISFHVGHSGSLCCQMYEMPSIIPKMQCFIQNHLRPRV